MAPITRENNLKHASVAVETKLDFFCYVSKEQLTCKLKPWHPDILN